MERLKLLISWLLILAGAVEAVWGLLQVYGYVASNHSLYALTGSFYNPGPYSGFLAMCVPVSLHEWLKGRRVWKHLALAALVLEKKAKVESTAIRQMREEVKKLMEEKEQRYGPERND